MATKSKGTPKAKRTLPAAFSQKFTPTEILGKIIGTPAVTRAEATKKIWGYIKSNKLQAGRDINADENLKVLFGGKNKVTMFELPKALSKNLNAAQ